jgi:hypothetical protein
MSCEESAGVVVWCAHDRPSTSVDVRRNLSSLVVVVVSRRRRLYRLYRRRLRYDVRVSTGLGGFEPRRAIESSSRYPIHRAIQSNPSIAIHRISPRRGVCGNVSCFSDEWVVFFHP